MTQLYCLRALYSTLKIVLSETYHPLYNIFSLHVVQPLWMLRSFPNNFEPHASIHLHRITKITETLIFFCSSQRKQNPVVQCLNYKNITIYSQTNTSVNLHDCFMDTFFFSSTFYLLRGFKKT